MSLLQSPSFPIVGPQGVDGLVVHFAAALSEPANRAALAFRAWLEAESWSGIEETSPALASVYIRFDPAAVSHQDLTERLRAALDGRDWTGAELGGKRHLWRVPTVYGGAFGPQLAEAAALAGRSPDEAVADLSSARVRVLTIGFAPGQPYLGQLPPAWNIPRQSGLTPQVPEGALVAAVRQFVLFANPSPTGWRHVGQTAFRCFRPEAADPFPLRPGDEVIFDAVPSGEFERLRAADPEGGGATRQALS